MYLAVYDGAGFGAENFPEALLITFFSMVTVFVILMFLMFIIGFFKYFKREKEQHPGKTGRIPVNWDMLDDDAKAAALVAAIVYHEETKEEAKLVSIKNIEE